MVARPLPYLYLAREVFDGAGLPFEALDTLPLAAEPYAAAVDVVLECAAANFTRRALMALLRSPHFRFDTNGADARSRGRVARSTSAWPPSAISAGSIDLTALAGTLPGAERPAARRRAVDRERAGAALGTERPLADQVDLLRQFLDRHDRRASRAPPPCARAR